MSSAPTDGLEGSAGPAISVVVCTRNRSRILADCVESLLKQEVPDKRFEIVVIDDGSSDDTQAVVERLATRAPLGAVRYHRQPHRGLNAARNAGIELSRGSSVAFLDDDELVPAGYLGRATLLLREHPEVSGVGGPCRDYHRPGPRTCRRCSLGAVDIWGEGQRKEARLLGGNMVVRRSAFERIGEFDPALSGRGDETEWFSRARELEFLFDPDLWVWHRRDHVSGLELCRIGFRQGRAIPSGRWMSRPWRPSLWRIGRFAGHALLFRCTRGAVLASREVGAAWSWLLRPFKRREPDGAKANPAGH